jgi:anti-sigma regulatory factor (Ser/Thr protein kinase)
MTLAERRRATAELEIKLVPDLRAPATARAFVRRHLPELGFPGLVDNGTLVAVELVTNAVKYAGGYGPIWLSLRLAGGGPLIEVQDCSPLLPEFQEPDYVTESGRGLHVVQALCAAFEWTQVDNGKVIFALLRTEWPPKVRS